MKKNGFILIETLLVITLVAVVFTILYIQFGVINQNYKITYNNNTVEKLYSTNNIKSFVLSNGYNRLIPIESYIDITSCSGFTSQSQCTNLIDVLQVRQAIILKDDLRNLKSVMLDDNNISDNFKKFITNLNYISTDNGYRLMVEYKDGQCASVRMWNNE